MPTSFTLAISSSTVSMTIRGVVSWPARGQESRLRRGQLPLRPRPHQLSGHCASQCPRQQQPQRGRGLCPVLSVAKCRSPCCLEYQTLSCLVPRSRGLRDKSRISPMSMPDSSLPAQPLKHLIPQQLRQPSPPLMKNGKAEAGARLTRQSRLTSHQQGWERRWQREPALCPGGGPQSGIGSLSSGGVLQSVFAVIINSAHDLTKNF